MSQVTSPIFLDTTGRDIVDAIESLGNRANDIENFTSSDVADGSATAWTSVTPLASGEVHSSIFAKISQMFKNIRYLYKMLGTTNISSIGGGTVTGAISALNSKLTLTGEYNYAESFSSAETLGSKLDELLNAQSSYVIGCYRLSCTASFGVFQNGYDYYVQMTRASSLSYVIAEFTPIDNGLIKIFGKRRTEGWSFELAPSRTEINALNSNRQEFGTVSVGNTFQLNSDILSKKLVVIQCMRYALGGSITLGVQDIKAGQYTEGVVISRGNGSANYWRVCFTTGGLGTILSTSTSTDAPVVTAIGFM